MLSIVLTPKGFLSFTPATFFTCFVVVLLVLITEKGFFCLASPSLVTCPVKVLGVFISPEAFLSLAPSAFVTFCVKVLGVFVSPEISLLFASATLLFVQKTPPTVGQQGSTRRQNSTHNQLLSQELRIPRARILSPKISF